MNKDKKMKKWMQGLAVAAVGIGTALSAQAQAEVDADLPVYEKVGGVAGNLNSIGSDTLNNLMTYWAEEFRKLYPNVNIQIEGKGSSTAPPALIEGTAQFGPMSRKMKDAELEEVEKKYGYKPTAVAVALDALAVYVNKDNPIDSMSLPQVDAAFSKTRKSEYGEDVVTWGQLGLTGDWAGLPISLYGRNSASGTYGFFKKKALFKGDFKDTVKEQPGSASVVLGVTEDKAGMGYSGIGYVTSGVKAIALSKAEGEEAFGPSYDNVLKGKYPLGRSLYVYVLKEPGKPLPVLQEQFFRLVLSKVGQEVVVKDGYLPLPAAVAAQQVEALTK